MANPELDNYVPSGEEELRESEERCARAEARIIELEGVIAGLRDKLDILVYPETAYKEFKSK